jgi:hypothetical protein
MRVSVPTGSIEAYEALRLWIVQPDGRGEHAEGRGVLIRCGLARWAQVQSSFTDERPLSDSHRQPVGSHPPGLRGELVRLVAGLILSIRQEGLHA